MEDKRNCMMIFKWEIFVSLMVTVSSLQTETTFNGSQYIAYPIPSHEMGSTYDRIVVDFKTSEPYGVLLYSGGTQGDFVSLEVIRGKLSYSADLGSIGEESGYHQLIIGDNVADNKWHHVVIVQNKKTVTIMLDKETKSMVAPGLFHRLDLDIMLYVGGIDKEEQSKHGVWVPKTRNFQGCLANVVFRSRDILHSAKFHLLNTVTHGGVPFQCRSQIYEPLGFINSNSKIMLSLDENVESFLFKTKLRTFEASGMVVTMATANGHLILAIVNGMLYWNITFDHLIGPERKVSIFAGYVNDGDWHEVEARVEKKQNSVSLKVGKEIKTYNFARHFELSRELGPFLKDVRIGGPSITYPGFVGCMQNVYLDGKPVVFSKLDTKNLEGISNQCTPKDLCFPNPCQNSGNCTQNHGQFSCKCPKSLFKGKNCETSIYKRTCDEIRKSGKTRSGTYRISPNGIDSFDVFCKMDHKLGPATIIHHTLAANTRVTDVGPIGRLYIYNIRYKPSKNSAVELADASTSCRQLISYNCFQSKLLDSLRRYRSEHTRGARWVSRDGIIQTYWGGARPGSKVCACGMPGQRNCADHHLDCNCDMGDKHWRKDEGYLTEKRSLPVTMVQFSIDQQQGPTQRSFFTVGNLECFGTAPLPTTTPPPTTLTMTSKATTSTIAATIKTENATTKTEPITTPLKARKNIATTYAWYTTTSEFNSSSNSSLNIGHLSNQDDLFPRPYLVTIVVIGTILCLLLIALVGLLFKAKVSGLLFRKSCPPKPHVEIEEYDQRSSVISSDWEFRIGTSFPTCTPDESTTTSEEDMRVRTLEDIRGRRRYGRLGTWGSRTASAPTLGGRIKNSRVSINDRRSTSRNSGLFIRDHIESNNRDDASSSQPYETSSESSKYTLKSTTNTSNSNSSRFSTCTEPGTCSDGESSKNITSKITQEDDQAEKANKISNHKNDLSSSTANPTVHEVKQATIIPHLQKPPDTRYIGNAGIADNYMRINGFSVPFTSSNTPQDGSRQYFTPGQVTNYIQRPHIRRIPQALTHSEYGTHLQLVSPINRCYYPPPVNRLVPVSKRPFNADTMPFLQQTIQEVDVNEEEQDMETNLIEENLNSRRNSGQVIANGFCRHENSSDSVDGNEEEFALLRQKIIEKATSLDD